MICRHGDNESDIFFSCQFGNNYYGKKGKVCILFGFGDGSSGTGCGDGDGLGTRAFDHGFFYRPKYPDISDISCLSIGADKK
jgi:hypothetical protein